MNASHSHIAFPPDRILISFLAICWSADSSTENGYEVIINGLRRGVGPKQRGIEKYRSDLFLSGYYIC